MTRTPERKGRTYNTQISTLALVYAPFSAPMEFDGSLLTIGQRMMESKAKQNRYDLQLREGITNN